MAVVCILQMIKTLQYSQSQLDVLAPTIFYIAVIMRSMEFQNKVPASSTQPQPTPGVPFAFIRRPSPLTSAATETPQASMS